MSRQVLLIDDSAMLRRIAAGVLRAQPARYEVVSATRTSEGFAKACRGETALILADERIACTSDADFCRRLLDERRTAGIPVVLLTGRQSDHVSLASLPDNVVAKLGKPFTPEELAGLVNTITALAKKGMSLRDTRLALHPPAETDQTLPLTDQELPSDEKLEQRPLAGTTSIRAALQAVLIAGQTGILRFHPVNGMPTEVFLENGRLLLVTTRDGAGYSRAVAEVLPAKVSPATLQEAADEQSRTGIPFLLTLGVRGLVSKSAAVELLRRFDQRYFSRLWTLSAGSLRIEFEPLEALPGFTLRLEPVRETMDEWLLETLRLLTSADLTPTARHQGLVGTPSLTRRGEMILQSLKISADEGEFIRRVTGRNDLPTIARTLGISAEEAFLLLHRFRCLEVLEYRPAPLPFVVTPSTNQRRVLPLQR